MTDSTTFQAGSPRQHEFIADLATRHGHESALGACEKVLGRDRASLLKTPPTTTEARKVIDTLSVKDTDPKPSSNSSTPAPGRASTKAGFGHYTTAKQLREFATGAKSVPSELDEHARWVLERLQQHERARALLAGEELPAATAVPRGVNGNQPITLEHLLEYYKNWDRLADAFRVTVPTAKAWGALLPESRTYEAEVKTMGYVRVPRNAQGDVA